MAPPTEHIRIIVSQYNTGNHKSMSESDARAPSIPTCILAHRFIYGMLRFVKQKLTSAPVLVNGRKVY